MFRRQVEYTKKLLYNLSHGRLLGFFFAVALSTESTQTIEFRMKSCEHRF